MNGHFLPVAVRAYAKKRPKGDGQRSDSQKRETKSGKGTRRPEYLLVDARTVPHCDCEQRGIIHGDALSASIAAASVIAKTTRDGYMSAMDKIYPEYGFASHKGYPTAHHLRALKEFGPLPLHRRSFSPVREILGLDPMQGELFP